MREESGREVDCGGAGQGWLHSLREGYHARRRHPRSATSRIGQIHDFGDEVAAAVEASSRFELEAQAAGLGVTVDALEWLGAFVDTQRHDLLCFPMRRIPGGTIVGVRVRDQRTGQKWSWTGSRGDALFIPEPLSDGELFLAEGPTDTAAMLGLGLEAIGRPNATGGIAWISRAALRRDVVVVADCDGVGQQGAEKAALAVGNLANSVRRLVPPDGVKDVREWIASGATVGDIRRAIQ